MNTKLLLLDMDGTLTPVKSPWQYVHEEIGYWEQDGEPLLKSYLAGQISYEDFCILDAKSWSDRGYSLDDINQLLDQIPLPDQTFEFLAQARDFAKIAIISTGFTRTARRIMARLGMDSERFWIAANSLEETEGTIKPLIHVVDRPGENGKAWWSRRFIARASVDPASVLAVGDSDSDIPMFREAGTFVRVNGPSDLAEIDL